MSDTVYERNGKWYWADETWDEHGPVETREIAVYHQSNYIRGMLEGQPWMTTNSGRPFFPGNPMPHDFDIRDIAHALANNCRFGGHSRVHYSVAQHSVLVSQVVPPEDALWGLLHDASEAYIIDLPSPVKRLPQLAGYMEIEAKVMAAVCERFGLPKEMPASVKEADFRVYLTEDRDIHWNRHGPDKLKPYDFTVVPMSHGEAKAAFLERFVELGGVL